MADPESRLRSALAARGLKLRREPFSYSIYNRRDERIAWGLSLSDVDRMARRKGYRTRVERRQEAETRAALAAKVYTLRRGRAGLAVIDADGQPLGKATSMRDVEIFLAP
jgi:hypothetical protein